MFKIGKKEPTRVRQMFACQYATLIILLRLNFDIGNSKQQQKLRTSFFFSFVNNILAFINGT